METPIANSTFIFDRDFPTQSDNLCNLKITKNKFLKLLPKFVASMQSCSEKKVFKKGHGSSKCDSLCNSTFENENDTI